MDFIFTQAPISLYEELYTRLAQDLPPETVEMVVNFLDSEDIQRMNGWLNLVNL